MQLSQSVLRITSEFCSMPAGADPEVSDRLAFAQR